MKRLVFTTLFCLALVGLADAQVTAIRAGKLVDPATGNVALNQIILVEGTDIKAMRNGKVYKQN